MKIRTARLPDFTSARLYLAMTATAFALLAITPTAHAQGIIGGAQQGSREGARAAGPVGAVVGGAIGAGVGGAVGAVNGVLGFPTGGGYRRSRSNRCRGYYDRRHRFHCYRRR